MDKEIRVPATTVQLVQILGTIIRDHLKVRLFGTECWTFQHVVNWEIWGEEPKSEAEESERMNYEYRNPEHRMSVYFGAGHLKAFGYGEEPMNAKRLDIRVRCEHARWVPTGFSFWDFQIWLKLPDGSVERHRFTYHLGYGEERSIHAELLRRMPANPPKKFAFGQPEEGPHRP